MLFRSSLPTASAVVSDVVDATKRSGDTAKIFWSREKRELGSVDAFTTPYFVRVKGTGIEKDIEEKFGNVQYIEGDKALGETAFITNVLSGSQFEQAAEKIEVVSRIRVCD